MYRLHIIIVGQWLNPSVEENFDPAQWEFQANQMFHLSVKTVGQ